MSRLGFSTHAPWTGILSQVLAMEARSSAMEVQSEAPHSQLHRLATSTTQPVVRLLVDISLVAKAEGGNRKQNHRLLVVLVLP